MGRLFGINKYDVVLDNVVDTEYNIRFDKRQVHLLRAYNYCFVAVCYRLGRGYSILAGSDNILLGIRTCSFRTEVSATARHAAYTGRCVPCTPQKMN